MFFNNRQFLPIDLKIGTHIDLTYAMYLAKYIDQNNVTQCSHGNEQFLFSMGRFSKL